VGNLQRVGAVVIEDNKLLLVGRKYRLWTPGGLIEHGSPLESLAMELDEELGVTDFDVEPFAYFPNLMVDPKWDPRIIDATFYCVQLNQPLKPKSEIRKAVFVREEEIRDGKYEPRDYVMNTLIPDLMKHGHLNWKNGFHKIMHGLPFAGNVKYNNRRQENEYNQLG